MQHAGIGVLEYTDDGGWAVDDSFLALLGFDRSDVGQDAQRWGSGLVHPDDRPLFDTSTARPAAWVCRIRNVAGVFIELRVRVIRRSGRIITICEGSDTARAEAHNAVLDRFASAVSHDLKAPLRRIYISMGWLQDEMADTASDNARENMEFVRRGAERLRHLIDGIVAYSRARGSELTMNAFSLDAAIREVVAAFPPGRVEVDGAPWPEVVGDRIQTMRVLQHLIDNALRHHGDQSAPIWVSLTASHDEYRITVVDRGPGIPPAMRAQVFDLFATGSPSDSGGSGVGLSICRALVQRWGGRIGIGDVPPHGTAVWFTLPGAQD